MSKCIALKFNTTYNTFLQTVCVLEIAGSVEIQYENGFWKTLMSTILINTTIIVVMVLH